MSWFGTDVRAVTCIVLGATLGGAATWAMAAARAHDHGGCVVEARALSPRVVVTGRGEAHTIVVAPNVRVRSHTRCGPEVKEHVEVRIDRHVDHLEQLEHLEVELEAMERELELKLEAVEFEGPEFAFELQRDIQAEVTAEMEKVFQELQEVKRLKKPNSGGIR
jgi:hypothetical protein